MPKNTFYQPRAPSSVYNMYGSMSARPMQGFFGNLVPLSQTKSLFLVMLNLPNLTRLTNDPINHQARWSVIPIKLPFDIPKFDGKPREEPLTHVMTSTFGALLIL